MMVAAPGRFSMSDRLPELDGKLRTDGAREEVRAAARRVGHDQTDLLGGVHLRLRRQGQSERDGGAKALE